MQLEMTMEARRLARVTDPVTSQDAARRIQGLPERQRAVWHCLKQLGPLADFELERRYGANAFMFGWPQQTASSLRTRRSELVRAGLVRRADMRPEDRRRTPTGGWAHVWMVASA